MFPVMLFIWHRTWSWINTEFLSVLDTHKRIKVSSVSLKLLKLGNDHDKSGFTYWFRYLCQFLFVCMTRSSLSVSRYWTSHNTHAKSGLFYHIYTQVLWKVNGAMHLGASDAHFHRVNNVHYAVRTAFFQNKSINLEINQ